MSTQCKSLVEGSHKHPSPSWFWQATRGSSTVIRLTGMADSVHGKEAEVIQDWMCCYMMSELLKRHPNYWKPHQIPGLLLLLIGSSSVLSPSALALRTDIILLSYDVPISALPERISFIYTARYSLRDRFL